MHIQWGHRLSAMETTKTFAEFEQSMALQWGHRLSAMETWSLLGSLDTTSRTFNGATAFRRWKRARPG